MKRGSLELSYDFPEDQSRSASLTKTKDSSLVGKYLALTKPERTLTNVLTALAGYLFASRWHFGWNLASILLGSTLIIASACVLNNYIDRGLDLKMARTKARALASGQLAIWKALVFAIILGAIGFLILAHINWLTFSIGVLAFIGYVVLYGAAKRFSQYGTLVGTIPGGASLVAGYTTVTDRFDFTALLLFLIMLAWQMAHFYAIAIYRLDDYRAAQVPVWPVKKGIASTKRQILFFVGLFLVANFLISIFGHTGVIYLVVLSVVGLYWLWLCMPGMNSEDDTVWAKQVFKFSLKVVVLLAVMLALGSILP